MVCKNNTIVVIFNKYCKRKQKTQKTMARRDQTGAFGNPTYNDPIFFEVLTYLSTSNILIQVEK